MERKAPKHLLLIDARAFAEKLAIPTFVTDRGGNLVFYNEPAEKLLGQSYAEAGEIKAEDWEDYFSVTELDGTPMPLDKMPAGIALLERRPAHAELAMVGRDGVAHHISVTALPLFDTPGELAGMFAMFWVHGNGDGDGSASGPWL